MAAKYYYKNKKEEVKELPDSSNWDLVKEFHPYYGTDNNILVCNEIDLYLKGKINISELRLKFPYIKHWGIAEIENERDLLLSNIFGVALTCFYDMIFSGEIIIIND